ncbi:hypothetical protein C5C10_03240 [Rathayibacter sp. AY1A3]|nr:hypothetical protein C5C10_03240 [Rathayibacter sp. AY1A3]
MDAQLGGLRRLAALGPGAPDQCRVPHARPGSGARSGDHARLRPGPAPGLDARGPRRSRPAVSSPPRARARPPWGCRVIRPDALFDGAELDAVRRLLPSGAADPDSAADGEPSGESGCARSALVDAAARCGWNSLTEPGDSVAALLIERVGAAEAFAHVVSSSSAEEILAPPHRAPSDEGGAALAPLDSEVAALQSGLARWRPRLDRRLLFRRLEIAERLGARLLLPGAPVWPESLDDLGPHAPLLLWLRGDPAAFDPPHRLALVGARAATGYGEHVAAELAAGVAARGVSVVSGGAFGIDAVAHRAALGSGGRTVAFLAGGADRLYPTAHADLLHRIIATPGCAVATEVPPGTTPTRWRFLHQK